MLCIRAPLCRSKIPHSQSDFLELRISSLTRFKEDENFASVVKVLKIVVFGVRV